MSSADGRELPGLDTLPGLILTLTALSGELPAALVSRLPSSDTYKEYAVKQLKRDNLLRTFYRNSVRSLRLTTTAKRLLLECWSDQFLLYLSGSVVADFYARHFIPNAWVFEHRTIACHEDDRILYITGKCDRCGGFMRSGTSVPTNVKGNELLKYVYREMEHFRPYDGHDQEKGTYCEEAGVPFYILDAHLYQDFVKNFGQRRTISIPWWTLMEDGHKSRMPRNCTIDYKVELIAKFVRWELLGYKKGQRLRPEDVKAHELHMGFGAEEKRRCKENPNKMFVNKFPLVTMGLTRADNYKYILEQWGLDTKASASAFCPFHRNFFYQYVHQYEPETYAAIVGVDNLLRDKTPMPPMKSQLFISRSRKRIVDLTPEDCNDAECFEYCGQRVWNGF